MLVIIYSWIIISHLFVCLLFLESIALTQAAGAFNNNRSHKCATTGDTQLKKKNWKLWTRHIKQKQAVQLIFENSNQIKTRTWDLSTEWTKRGQVQDWCQNEKFLFRMLGCIVLSKKRWFSASCSFLKR